MKGNSSIHKYTGKILCFDVETDGLYGEAFAIGAVVYQNGKRLGSFEGTSRLDDVHDVFVRDSIVPLVRDMPSYSTRYSLRRAFWEWYKENYEDALILCDFSVPVESNVIRQCIIENENYTDFNSIKDISPYPLHDLGSILLAKGYDPDIDRLEFMNSGEYSPFGKKHLIRHNPVHDSIMTVLCFYKVMQ